MVNFVVTWTPLVLKGKGKWDAQKLGEVFLESQTATTTRVVYGFGCPQ